MFDSDPSTYLIIGAILYLVIIYQIIASASRARRIHTELMRQSLYMREMAKKQGVDEKELDAIDKEFLVE